MTMRTSLLAISLETINVALIHDSEPPGSHAVYVGRWRSSVEESLMKSIRKMLARLVRVDHGTETLEWGLICGLIVVGAIAAVTLIGPKITKLWNEMNSSIP